MKSTLPVNGRLVEVEIDERGEVSSEVIRQAGAIEADRELIHCKPDGSNHVLNRGQSVAFHPGESFDSSPRHTRG